MRNYWETASLGLSSAIVCGFLCSSWSSPPQFGVYPNGVRYLNLTVFLKGWMQRAACERSPSGIAEANWFHMSVIRSDAVPASIEVLSIARRSERVTHEQWEKKELSDFINMTSSWEKWAEVDSWVFGSLFFFFSFFIDDWTHRRCKQVLFAIFASPVCISRMLRLKSHLTRSVEIAQAMECFHSCLSK